MNTVFYNSFMDRLIGIIVKFITNMNATIFANGVIWH